MGMRFVDIPLIKEVCAKAGPITATSANLHGKEGALVVEEAVKILRDRLEIGIAVDHGELPGGHSAVVDIRGGHERVLRERELRRK